MEDELEVGATGGRKTSYINSGEILIGGEFSSNEFISLRMVSVYLDEWLNVCVCNEWGIKIFV